MFLSIAVTHKISSCTIIHQPRPEEPTEGRRLEGRPRARPCRRPSFETPCCARLLRMRSVDAITEGDQQKDTHHYSCLASPGFNRREVRRFRKQPARTAPNAFSQTAAFDGTRSSSRPLTCRRAAPLEQSLSECRSEAAYSVTSETATLASPSS